MAGMLSHRAQYRKHLAAVCAAVTLAVLIFAHVPKLWTVWSSAELTTRDWLISRGRHAETRQDIVFLAIDNASITLDEVWDINSPFLAQIQKTGFPWPRDSYPYIIERLADAGAKVIAFDMVFPSPKEGDGRFRRCIEKYKDKVVIGSSFESVEVAAGEQQQRTAMDQYQPPAPTIVMPGSDLDRCVGFVNVWLDPLDNVARRVHYARRKLDVAGIQGGERPPEFLSLAARILEKAGESKRIPDGTESRIVRWVSQDSDPKLDPVNRNFVPHSLYRIFVDDFWKKNYGDGAFFKDKIVLIGPYGQWSKDVIPSTPFGEMPGPLFHLNAVNAALENEFIREAPPWLNIVIIILAGFAAWFLSYRVENAITRLICFMALTGGYWGAAQCAYNFWPGEGLLLLLFSPLAAFVGSGGIWFTAEQIVEQAERRRVRGIFERYVSRNVVKEILDNPQSFLTQLGGVRKECVILFTDLRGFTARTESGDSHQLVAQLNEYFDEMVKIVFEYSGTFDKCIGDAVMAVWGNIHSEGRERDIELALQAALKMGTSLKRLNEGWREKGWADFAMGAGINQGEVIAGNMGSVEKMEVTVIGDAVNLASRLESATKEYGVNILVGENAGLLVKDKFFLQTVDRVRLMGKSKPVEVFTPLGHRSEALESTLEQYLTIHEEGVELYRSMQFAAAREKFLRCEEIRPGIKLTKLYISRCELLAANPPEGVWDGVFVMTKK